ncbi:MAG: glucosidase, partial [Mucilaginibacter sp.]
DDFKIECPTGSGNFMNLQQVAVELYNRLSNLFLRDDEGRRAVYGDYQKMQTDPDFKDYILFHEYFDGDTGRGMGASHQTGWTGLIAVCF